MELIKLDERFKIDRSVLIMIIVNLIIDLIGKIFIVKFNCLLEVGSVDVYVKLEF